MGVGLEWGVGFSTLYLIVRNGCAADGLFREHRYF
jgi:hypothetical protein